MLYIRPTEITDAILVSSDVPETDYAEYVPATTYADGDHVIVTDAGVHKIYESLQNANTGHYPPANPTWWQDQGATNRWKPFDDKVNSQASQANTMNFVLAPGIIDSIALLNLDATEAGLVMTDPIEGEVYNETIDLLTTISVSDWYTYFFEPIVRDTDVLRTDLAEVGLPPYVNAELSITINNPGGTAKCGEIVVGIKSQIGRLLNNPAIGITDYSIKEVDEWGNYTITERAYSKRMSIDVRVKNTIMDEIVRQLTVYRATPLVWVGSELYSSLIVYGFYKNFEMVLPGYLFSECSLEIEGLT